MAAEEFEQANAYVDIMVKVKRDEIAEENDEEDEHAKDAPDMPNDMNYDDTLPDFGEPASSSTAPASSRAPAEQKTKVNFAGDAAEEDGGAVRSGPGKDEFHHLKPIKMKDLPTNICVWRVDIKTYRSSSGVDFRLLHAQLPSIRRHAIEAFMDPTTYSANHLYVPHEYQAPIRLAMEAWWEQ